jgi:hypothetical protein
VEFFFDSRYRGYVLDDELVSSKASDIEHKLLVTERVEVKVQPATVSVILLYSNVRNESKV